MKYKIVKVIWSDSYMRHGQWEPDFNFTSCIMETVGFLVQENKKDITIARDIDTLDGGVREPISIPRENIKSIKIVG